MKQVHDQTGKIIFIPTLPRRIISVVPSQSELLADIGLNEEVIGITKFCVHPQQWLQTKINVGGTKQLKLSLIQSLKPDLVIANKEENVKEQIEAIEKFCPVWCSDIVSLADTYNMIEQLGYLTGCEQKAHQLINTIKNSFAELQSITQMQKAAYLIWRDPYITVGADTFINTMLNLAGFENVFADRVRYPEVTVEELLASGAKVILFSSEPFPFKEKHLEEIKVLMNNIVHHQLLPKLKIVDGELFSWYGSRLLYSANYFMKLRESLFLNDEFTL